MILRRKYVESMVNNYISGGIKIKRSFRNKPVLVGFEPTTFEYLPQRCNHTSTEPYGVAFQKVLLMLLLATTYVTFKKAAYHLVWLQSFPLTFSTDYSETKLN